MEELFDHMGIASQRVQFKVNTKDTTHFHPYRSAEVYVEKIWLVYWVKFIRSMPKQQMRKRRLWLNLIWML